MKRDAVDFHALPAGQEAIDSRLDNWGRWCHGSPRSFLHPMWRYYRSEYVWQAPEVRPTVDVRDALLVERAVVALPEKHRHAIQWAYVVKCTPIKACRRIGCTPADLAALVDDGRWMLINGGL